jgi:L-glyceraldehyde 3-phosphate reductase
VRAGKTRYVGFSNFDRDPALARRAVAYQERRGWTRFVSSQPRFSLVERSIERGHLAFCRAKGLGILAYSPLAQGVLTNKYADGAVPAGSRATGKFAHFLTAEKALTPENVAAAARFAAWVARRGAGSCSQVALAWVLRRPEVSSVLLGVTSVAQLEENLGAGEVSLTETEWAEVEAATAGPRPASPRRPMKPRRPTTRTRGR